MAKDFVIDYNDRYGISREQFINNIIKEFKRNLFEGNKYHYGIEKHNPLIPYEKVEVGHRLYRKPWESKTSKEYEEVEIVYKYERVIFYVKVEDDDKKVDFVSKDAPAWQYCFYPKVILKPSFIELTCTCPLTKIKNW